MMLTSPYSKDKAKRLLCEVVLQEVSFKRESVCSTILPFRVEEGRGGFSVKKKRERMQYCEGYQMNFGYTRCRLDDERTVELRIMTK